MCWIIQIQWVSKIQVTLKTEILVWQTKMTTSHYFVYFIKFYNCMTIWTKLKITETILINISLHLFYNSKGTFRSLSFF